MSGDCLTCVTRVTIYWFYRIDFEKMLIKKILVLRTRRLNNPGESSNKNEKVPRAAVTPGIPGIQDGECKMLLIPAFFCSS